VNHCFSDLLEGIQDFGKNAGVKTDQLPTEQESTEIKKEIEALPPIGWLTNDVMAPVSYTPSHTGALRAYAAMQGVLGATGAIQAGEGAFRSPYLSRD
jgi:hypothetical protein